jgi:hypothetical protein
VGSHPGELSPRAARSIGASERFELSRVARGLPSSWALSYSAYTGQTSILPTLYVPVLEPFMHGGPEGDGKLKRRRPLR